MKALVLTLASMAALIATNADAAIIEISGTWTGAEAVQGTERLLRNAQPSEAGTQKAFPGTTSDNPVYFVIDALSVAPGSLISVQETANNSTNGFFSIYSESFDPSNLAGNYIGDAGLSGPDHIFSVFAPASGQVDIVASSVYGTSAIGQQYDAVVNYTSAVPEPSTWAMMLLGFGGIGFLAYRKTRSRDAAAPMFAA